MVSVNPVDSDPVLGINVVVKDEEGEVVDYLTEPMLSWGVKEEQEEVPCHLGEHGGCIDQAIDPSESPQKNQQGHTTETNYPCLACGKYFYNSSTLRRHMRTHTGERPYHCSECLKTFSHPGALKDHQRIHSGERPYVCAVSACGKSFINSGALKKHSQTHTGEKPHCCSDCGRGFSQLAHLQAHQRTHTGERPYHCSLCWKSFIQQGHLDRHRRIHLAVDTPEDQLSPSISPDQHIRPIDDPPNVFDEETVPEQPVHTELMSDLE